MGSKFLILFFSLLFAHSAFSQQTIILGGVIRDQAPNTMLDNDCKGWVPNSANGGQGFYGTDFQLPTNAYSNNEWGLCGNECNQQNGFTTCGMLGDDQTPVYRFTGKSPQGNVQSPASFYNWFHTTSQNVPVNVNITLTKNSDNSTYTYSNDNFFPINNKGWGDYCVIDNQRLNFGFCMEAHTRFGYKGTETFYFSGDDDLWVYINGYLVIDLGSLHPRADKSLTLSTLPFLVRDNNYRMDFFYCERHTQYSRIKVTTTLSLYCSYEDWCGLCEGSGQSCCTQSVINQYCNDNDACTTDTCAVRVSPKVDRVNGCVHTPIACTTTNSCKIASCNKNSGCQLTDRVCTAPDVCTIASCDPTSGCKYTARVCNDNKACTVDTCDKNRGGCVYTLKNCSDGNACTNDGCDNSTGCTYSPVTCNDNNACTRDSCNVTTGCVNQNLCVAPDSCTNVQCSATVGTCLRTPVNCSTGNKCRNETCNPSNGACSSVDISNTVCPYRDNCSIPVCNPASGCSYQPKNCDFGDKCMIYSCDLVKGCQATPNLCNDGTNCTYDYCNRTTGCYNPVIPLDDNNKCTTDTCDIHLGVIHTNISSTCNDGNACTQDSCVPASGCYYKPVVCAQTDVCSTYSCNRTSTNTDPCVATKIPGCTSCTANGAPVNCSTTDKCFPRFCATPPAQGCANTTVTCDDNNECTDNICNDGACSNPVKAACTTSSNQCKIPSCASSTLGCVTTDRNCNDNNPCTIDSCNPSLAGGCVNTPIPNCISCGPTLSCNNTDLCNPCNSNTCQNQKVDCNDGNACTQDSCYINANGAAACSNAFLCQSSGDACRPNVCNPSVGCQIQPVVCNDNDKCTNDSCIVSTTTGGAQCQYLPLVCNTTDLCNPSTCSAATGQCVLTPVSCNDNDACTNDSCVVVNNSTTCANIPFICASDACGAGICNSTTGQCASAFATLNCDDGNPCTDDIGSCYNDSTQCNNTINSFCDDHDLCTNEMCDSSNTTYPCSYTNVTCTAPNVCTIVSGCNATTGCVFAPVVCPPKDNCNLPTCDLVAGCIFVSKVCTVDDEDCYEAYCSPTTDGSSPCGQRQLDWGVRVQCALKYNKGAAIGIGAAVGIAVAGAVALGVAGYGGKKGYDHLRMMREQRFGGVQNNPLYETTQAASDNPLYRYSTGTAPPS